MKSKLPLSLILILCGTLCLVGAVGLVAYHGSIGFKGSTTIEEFGFLAGVGLVALGIGIAVWRRGR